MEKYKKGGVLVWILIILVLAAVGFVVYDQFFGGIDNSIINSIIKGNSVPTPPALPNE